MEQEFKEGDVVVLKSNHTLAFTIASIGENREAQCYYIHDNQPKWVYLPITVLVKN